MNRAHLRVGLLLCVAAVVLASAGSSQAATNPLTATTSPYFASQQTHVTVGSYAASATQTVTTAATNSNYVFAGWTVSDSTATVSPALSTTATFTMGQNSCLLTANYASQINRVPLNISGFFNMDTIVGPIVASQATFAGSSVSVWLGVELQGFGATYGNGNQNQLVCDSSSNDGLSGISYKYNCTGNGGFTGSAALTGSQGLPENGIIYSAADSSNPRTYVLASVSGNYMLPGDWTEPAYVSASNGTLIGANITYGPNTYTASNYKFNAIWVGQTANSRNTPSVTASVQPAYYSDVNLLLAGAPAGCAYTQIWATYANVVNGSNSLKLYDWTATGSLPIITLATASPSFTLAYKLGMSARNGSGSRSEQVSTGFYEYLWEFTNPLTLDPNRVLLSITISSYRGGGNNSQAIAVFAATASASTTASNTLTLQQNAAGTISATPSVTGYPYGAQVTLAAAGNTAIFSSWNITPSDNASVSGNTGSDTLTIFGNVTVSANFDTSQVPINLAQTTGGTVAISPVETTAAPGDVLQITYTLNNGYSFSGWNITDFNNESITPSFVSDTAFAFTVPNSAANVSANFAPLPYSATASMNVTGGSFTMNPAPTGGTYYYHQQVALSATASTGWQLVSWQVTGGASLSSSTNANATLTVTGSFTLTASFAVINYNVSGVPSPTAGGSLTLTPTGGATTTGVLGQTITVTGTYQQTVAITETPGPGYYFNYMTVTGGATLSSNSSILTIGQANVTLTVYFTGSNFPVVLGSNSGVSYGSGAVTISGGGLGQCGSSVTITETPSTGYVFVGWHVTDTNGDTIMPVQSSGGTYTFTMPASPVTVSAVFSSVVIGRVPLNISNAFNMNCLAGPVAASQATLSGSSLAQWLGNENNGFAFNWYGTPMPCDTSSYDGLTSPNFLYYCKGSAPYTGGGTTTTTPGYQTIAGSQGLPENGLLYSVADGLNNSYPPRTYCLASVSGNYLLPGDWTEPAYISTSNGVTLPGSPVAYSPSTYTAFNPKYNAILVGDVNTLSYLRSSVTAAVQPGYYSDLNLLLAGGTGTGGCEKSQIWAVYADNYVVYNNNIVVYSSNSLLLFDWGTTNNLPLINASTASPSFTLVATVAAQLANSASPATPRLQAGTAYLWEFTQPLTLDPTRVLVGVTIASAVNNGDHEELAVFAATASAATTASNTLTLQQNPNGTVSASQSGVVTQVLPGYPYGAQVTLTASANTAQNYGFCGWNVSPAGNGTITVTGSQAVLTIYGNVTVSANFALIQSSYSGSETATGGSIILSSSGPYTYNQAITATASAQTGYTFAGWSETGSSTISSSSALTTTLTVYDNFSLTASFTADTFTTSVTLDNTWVYQNTAETTFNRHMLALTLSVQDTWPDTVYTVVVAQSGSGVVVPSLTFVTANGIGTVTPTSSFVFSGSSTTLYLIGSPLQPDGITGTGSCTVTVQVTGDAAGAANATTNQATLTVRRLGDINVNRTVTTADRVQLKKWLNGLPTPNLTVANFDLDGDGTVGASDLSLLNDLLNHLAVPPTTLTLTAAASPAVAGTVTVTPSRAINYYGDQLTIATTANANYGFTGWSVTGGTVANSSAASTLLTVEGNVTLTANFAPVYTVTLSPGPQGTATMTPSQANYFFGQQTTITISTITAGNVLDHWVLNGPGTLSNSGALSTLLTFAAGNVTLTAVYASGSYVNNLSPTASDSNVGSLTSPFKTITRALVKGMSGWARPGDTIVVQQGRYYEQVNYGYANNGTAGQPITVRSNPGDRVIADGALPIPLAGQGWTQCTSATASGNPNYAHIYYTDINWSWPYVSGTVFEDESPLVWSKTPSIGWWSVTATSDTTAITDTVNLTQTDSNYWVGAKVFYFDMEADGQWLTSSIMAFSPGAHALTVPHGASYLLNVGDAYVIENYLPSMNAPGQVVVWPSGSNYRVFVWPRDNDRPDGHLFEGSYNYGHAEIPLNKNYLTLNGFEVAFSNQAGLNPSASYAIIQNCVIHHNDGGGVTGGAYINILNNYVTWNGNERVLTSGLAVTGHGSLVQGNEISHNSNDNIDFCANSSSLVGNYVHNADLYGHADNFQVYANAFGPVGNILVKDNYLIDAESQQCMMQQLTGITFSNNAVIFGGNGFNYHADVNNVSWIHNTCGYGPGWWFNAISGAGIGFQLDSNIWVQPNYAIAYVASNQAYTADYNLYWHTLTTTNTTDMVIGLSNGNFNFANYVQESGQDADGRFADPQFTNMALLNFQVLSSNNGNTPTRFYVWNGAVLDYCEAGDYIEIDRDGVRRQITSVNPDTGYVDFTPSKAAVAFKVGHALNWKNNSTNWAIDLSPRPGSPVIGAGSSGTNIGCNLYLPNYEQGNFGVYGKRPVWPTAPVNLAAAGWSYTSSGTPHALTEGNTYTNPNLTGFKLTFGAPLYALSCTNSAAVKVVDNNGTTYPINAATLDSTGEILTITLTNGALPRNVSWIEVIMNPAIMGVNGADPTVGTNGGPVTGVKSVRFTIN